MAISRAQLVKELEPGLNAILDKLGENSIKWEYLGNNCSDEINRITYEEVIDDTRHIQTKKVLGVEVGTGASY